MSPSKVHFAYALFKGIASHKNFNGQCLHLIFKNANS